MQLATNPPTAATSAMFLLLPSLTLSLLALAIHSASIPRQPTTTAPVTAAEWHQHNERALAATLNFRPNPSLAHNIILFVGDGLDVNTQTAARLYEGGEFAGRLHWQQFPHLGLLRNWCTDGIVCDSAATANALFSGHKTRRGVLGVDAHVEAGNWTQAADRSRHLQSIVALAQAAGMRTGFVTNTRVMHATPAALFAHSADRRWECEERMPEAARREGVPDLARELIEGEVGGRLNVIMGGGRQLLVSGVRGTAEEPLDSWACQSRDGRDLMADWRRRKMEAGRGHRVVETRAELMAATTTEADYVLGIFANAHMGYEFEERERPEAMRRRPTLAEMTVQAVKVLQRGSTGFLLVVEGGMIDQALHRGWARIALDETVALSRAVEAARQQVVADETLVVVTADHGLTLSINGYAPRGESVLGIAQRAVNADAVPYTTLSFATGGPGSWRMQVVNGSRVLRADPGLEATGEFRYEQQAAIRTDEVTHSGADMTVHATGPRAALFNAVRDQTYVAEALGVAGNLGCDRRVAEWRRVCG